MVVSLSEIIGGAGKAAAVSKIAFVDLSTVCTVR